MTSEFLIVAEQVLLKAEEPMTAKEIVSWAIKEGLFSDKRAGKTPHQTMKSKLSVNIRRLEKRSLFVRTSPGKFYLRCLLSPGEHAYEAEPIQKPKSSEDVLVFGNDWLSDERRFQGIKTSWKRLYKELLRPESCEHINRQYAETIDTHKQVLTYILVTRGDKVLAYRRGNYNRAEDYLKGSECIGFGGHVSRTDIDLLSENDMGVINCAVRELSEEISLPEIDKNRLMDRTGLSCIGVLNDDSTPVGQRHFAFILRYEVSEDPAWDNPQRGEKSITQLRWLNASSTPIPIWRFEYWSQLCLREFFSGLASEASAYNINRKRPLLPPHLLCVVGGVGSGKSETTKILCREFGYKEVNTGKVLAGLIDIPPIPETPREEFQRAAWDYIQSQYGPENLSAAILGKAAELGGEKILVDGIRQKATLNYIQELSDRGEVGVLYIHTLPDLAFEFYRSRERQHCSIYDFIAVRNAEVELEVGDMIAKADAVLYNWRGRAAYIETIRRLVDKLGVL